MPHAKGDIQIGKDATTAGILPAGADGRVLALDSTQILGVTWAVSGVGGSSSSVAPFVSVRRAVAQEISNAAYNIISFDTEVEDTDNMFVIGSPTIITIQTAGVYDLVGGIELGAGGTGLFLVALHKSNVAGTNQIVAQREITSTTDTSALIAARHYRLVATDVISLQCFQSTGGAKNTAIGEQSMFLTALKVRD